ncbi:MAG: coenzyme F420-0:L-glutamate ligase [Chloroflexota bacterium]|nr:coenzyme F420-0:L-glutamate ligase [Chloroflexota bacterium]MDE2896501.1 coenzyme F420-0:L-glutamate ligase [Chloroflexota bacterium]
MAPPSEYRVFAVGGIPEVVEGDDLAGLIHSALIEQETPLESGDVLLVTQKIVSKAEGRVIQLDDVSAGGFAQDWADDWEKDARAVELVLSESKRIVRMTRGLILSETRHGWVCANAGVDQSNVGGGDAVTLLPVDSSASALAIRRGLVARGQVDVPVIVTDTFGRPWRNGLTNVAIGVSGMNPIRSYVGEVDAEGYDLRVTEMAIVDELASAAEPVMNKLDKVPVAVVRGLNVPVEEYDHTPLVRPAEMDLFR